MPNAPSRFLHRFRGPLGRLRWLLAPALAAGWAGAAAPGPAGNLTAKEVAQGYRDGVVIAKPRAEMVPAIDQAESAEGLQVWARFERFGHLGVLRLPAGEAVPAAIARLQATGRYAYVEPDVIRHGTTVPNDPSFTSQWALNNTGANGGGGGIAGADIHAEAGWGVLESAPSVIVAVIDSGALLNHEDLAANLWINPHPGTTKSYASVDGSLSETDAANGLNAVAMSGDPTDDLDHGTHVSGIIGAVGNNALGVTGVAWTVQLMELKFIDSANNGSISAELPCIEYAIANGAKVINASFGSPAFTQAEMDAIQAAGKAGVIFVCAAGNNTKNIDISNFFPAAYPLDNLICCGASDNRDLPAVFSNYGSGSVEIFAPGANIYSTIDTGASAYGYMNGTSMAAPFVTGTVALLRALYPTDTYREIINRVLNCADPLPALAGKAQTGGRLNLATALTTAPHTPPNALFTRRMVLTGPDPSTRSNNADSPAALEAGTPAIAGGPGGHSLWWSWTAPANASVEIDTSGSQGGALFTGGSTYATLLGVYTGSSLGSLQAVGAAVTGLTEPLEGSGGTKVPYSEVKFEATAGTTYQINVEGQGGASGQTVLSISSDPDYDSIATPRVLTGRSVSLLDVNLNATRESGEPLILGNPGGHSLWYSWTAPYTGTAQVSVYSYDFDPVAAVYTGTGFSSLALVNAAQSSAITGTTEAAGQCLCTFSATAGTTYLISVDGTNARATGEFTLSLDDSLWQAVTGDSVTCSPAVGADGTVYVGSTDSSFYAYSAGGSLKWSHAAAGAFDTSSAAIGPDGTVYAACGDGNLYAFNGSAGSVKWSYPFPASMAPSSSPSLAADGTIFVHGTDGKLYALTPAGALRWTFAAAGVSYAAPTIAPDGTVYIGTDGGLFYAVNPDGTQKWAFTAPVAGESIYTAAAIDAQGNVYFATLTGNVYSLDAAGTLRWSYAVGDGVTSAPALANGAVYFGGYDGYLYALTTAGALQWRYALGTQVRASAPAVDAHGVVYVGCYDHNLYAVSAGGSLVRTYATDDIIRSSPVISGSSLYCGSSDHKLYAFGLAAGPAASDWPMYQYGPTRPGRAVASALAITSQPPSEAVTIGSPLSISVGAEAPGALTYQWKRNGVAINGAVSATYTVASATPANAGTYTVVVTSGSASVTSSPAVVTVSASTPGRLINLSARASVGTGGNILIAGFVISGSGSKSMLLRGIGPALGAAPFDVAGALAQPQLTLVNSASGATVASGAAWGGGATLTAAFAQVGAFALPAGSVDAAILETLPTGAYTSEIAGVGGTQGVALAEIYDANPSSTSASLANISARASVGTGGNILIAGLVVEGSQPVKVLLRGIGPALGAAPFNLPGALAQPQIELFNSAGGVIQSNAGWGGAAALASVFTQVGAFQLPAGSADAAMVATLAAGNYTLQLSGVNATTGVGLIEVYLVP